MEPIRYSDMAIYESQIPGPAVRLAAKRFLRPEPLADVQRLAQCNLLSCETSYDCCALTGRAEAHKITSRVTR